MSEKCEEQDAKERKIETEKNEQMQEAENL